MVWNIGPVEATKLFHAKGVTVEEARKKMDSVLGCFRLGKGNTKKSYDRG
jgi:hypothetical protein